MPTRLLVAALWAAQAVAPPASAACPTDLEAAALAARHVARQAIANPGPELTLEDAQCGRDKLNRFLAQAYGRPVGYKAGLTNPAVQKRFNHGSPVRGTLFEKMLLPDGAVVPAGFGARPVYEADLVVEVKDAAINRATTPAEVLRHVARLYPFIELPDLMLEDPTRPSGPALVLVNAGARLGVLGKPLAVNAGDPWVEALAAMTVRLFDQDGKELDSGPGSAILGHPLEAVIWLAGDLKKAGTPLKKGDLLSLGAFSKPLRPTPGGGARVVYEGLRGNPSVSVRFQ